MEGIVRQLPELAASTGTVYCGPVGEIVEQHSVETTYIESNYFKHAQWTPDGTTLLTSSADNTIRTFILPPTLLDPRPKPLSLTPYTTHLLPVSINCLSPYPWFDLSTPTTTLYLSAPSSLPIRLTNAVISNPTPAATYPLVCPTTEAFLTPSSLCWSSSGTHFLAGTDCLVSVFDISRSGSGPLSRMPTIPSKRHRMKGGGVGMRGIVSTLAIQPYGEGMSEGLLAAGTWTRWVGLYDAEGMGGTVANWEVKEAADGLAQIGGGGVSQVGWSACGHFLYVVERKSRGLLVYDVRFTRKLVCWLEGRNAITNQRLGVEYFRGVHGAEIWAGGIDGNVRVWEGIGHTEGAVLCSWEWDAHQDPVTSTAMHSTGSVVATCSGQRGLPEHGWDSDSQSSDDGEQNESFISPPTRVDSVDLSPDNSIKVWKM